MKFLNLCWVLLDKILGMGSGRMFRLNGIFVFIYLKRIFVCNFSISLFHLENKSWPLVEEFCCFMLNIHETNVHWCCYSIRTGFFSSFFYWLHVACNLKTMRDHFCFFFLLFFHLLVLNIAKGSSDYNLSRSSYCRERKK